MDVQRLGTTLRMIDGQAKSRAVVTSREMREPKKKPSEGSRRLLRVAVVLGVCTIAIAAVALWIGAKVASVSAELSAATALVSPLKESVANSEPKRATATVNQIRVHTAAAKDAAGDPIWTLASAFPGIGPNLSAVSEVSRAADDVANLGLAPLIQVFGSLDWDMLVPSSTGTELAPLKAASPKVSSAAHAVKSSVERLEQIDTSGLLPQVSLPLTNATKELRDVTDTLDAAAGAASIVPDMLGADSPRTYLLMVQNNAEVRSSGGIPGALALLTFDAGKLTLGEQSSASELGSISPPIAADPEQTAIYSSRLGRFIQDVNLTPDFPTAATLAQSFWEKKKGLRVDGVISVDPLVLSYILDATGPVNIENPQVRAVAGQGLPTELNSENVVRTLLSDVYAKIQEPKLQDAYFAAVAQEIFTSLSGGKGDAGDLLRGITRGAEEGRVLVWASNEREQSILEGYALSGSVAGPSVLPAQFGIYFNDGTGAKMDYYVKRTVQLVKECPKDGYEQTTVRVTSTNTAPADAATSLPAYVTGDGVFGVPPGAVQTNIVAYGPVQAQVETAKLDGQKTEFAPYIHSNRPVGILAIRLAPGESRTVDFTFGKIVQHLEPNLVVTPTVQDVKDVTLLTETVACS